MAAGGGEHQTNSASVVDIAVAPSATKPNSFLQVAEKTYENSEEKSETQSGIKFADLPKVEEVLPPPILPQFVMDASGDSDASSNLQNEEKNNNERESSSILDKFGQHVD